MCPPNKNCAPQARIVPKESNRLGATEEQFEAWDSQDTAYHLRTREQELFFRRFCNKDPFFFGFTPEFVKISAFFLKWRAFFVFTPEFVKIRAYFEMKTFFLVHTLGFEVLKFLCPPPKICLCPPVTLSWRRTWLADRKDGFSRYSPKCWHWVGQMICWLSGHRPQYTSRTARRTVNAPMHSKIYFATTVNSNTENKIYSALKIEQINQTR